MKKIDKLINTLYCITSEAHSNGKTNAEVSLEMLLGGAKVIQYREKDKTMLSKYNECFEIRKLTKEHDALLIINDDIALALALNADGVHIGQDDLPIEEVRKIVGKDMIIGLSTHSKEQANNAVKNGADYIGVGPIFLTKTKKDVCSPVGLEYLDYAVKNIKIPFVAIGGIKMHNIDEVLEHGAKTVCMVSEIVGASDVKKVARETIEKIRTFQK